jgi:hypothetical protein
MTRRLTTAMTGRILLIAGLAIGCGGKQADTTPTGGASETEPTEGTAGQGGQGGQGGLGGEMIPPEVMDEITRSLQRKRQIVSHCLATAVDNKELPKNSRGKVTLEIVIAPSGKPSSVKVIRATLDSRSLNDCVIHHVEGIQFPELPRPYETSFTYGFEAT